MLAVPAALLDRFKLRAGAAVILSVEDGQLIVSGLSRARHTLADLLAQCDPTAEMSEEDREWAEAGPVGEEPL